MILALVLACACTACAMAISVALARSIVRKLRRWRNRKNAAKGDGLWVWEPGKPPCSGFLYARMIPEGFPGCDTCVDWVARWEAMNESGWIHPEFHGVERKPFYMCPTCFRKACETWDKDGQLTVLGES